MTDQEYPPSHPNLGHFFRKLRGTNRAPLRLPCSLPPSPCGYCAGTFGGEEIASLHPCPARKGREEHSSQRHATRGAGYLFLRNKRGTIHFPERSFGDCFDASRRRSNRPAGVLHEWRLDVASVSGDLLRNFQFLRYQRKCSKDSQRTPLPRSYYKTIVLLRQVEISELLLLHKTVNKHRSKYRDAQQFWFTSFSSTL
jgi:hypothetical protein